MIELAVILAAGKGSRFAAGRTAAHDFSKPLLDVGGKSLLGHALHSCTVAGVRKAIAVTGYRADLVSAELARCGGIETAAVFNERWEEPNGVSVAAVRGEVEGSFLLLMADHLFDHSILIDLAAQSNSADVVLAVDPRVHSILDLDDATKVRREGDRIVDIGKRITDYDSIDCGLFRCSPNIFDALERASHRKPPSLTDGLQELIRTGDFRAMEIGDRWWQDVDTPEMAELAAQELKRRGELDGQISV